MADSLVPRRSQSSIILLCQKQIPAFLDSVSDCFSVSLYLLFNLWSRFDYHVIIKTTPAHQAPLSMEFSNREYWSELLLPSPGDVPNPEIEPRWIQSNCIAGGFFTIWATRETHKSITNYNEERPFMCKLMIEEQEKQYYSRIDPRTIMTVLLHFLLCINLILLMFLRT